MPRTLRVSDVVRSVLFVLAVVMLSYLAGLALWPWVRERIPTGLRGFGEPGSVGSITLVVAVLAAVCLLTVWPDRPAGSGTTTVRIIVWLTAANFVLGMSSYWGCYGETRPKFYTPLMWTIGLLKGGVGDQSIKGRLCPERIPIALDVARLMALAAILVGIAGVVFALVRSKADRLRVRFAKSVTVVLGIDDDTRAMVKAVHETLDPGSRLVVVTESPDRPCVQECRRNGARVIVADLDRPQTLGALPLWSKLDRLYLLASDPSANLARLEVIGAHASAVSSRHRVPLIVRIDDPWQASAWRAGRFGGSDTRWAADAVGRYEATARQLLDRIINKTTVSRVMVCGTSPLTLAVCADMAQRDRERDFHAKPGDAPLPTIVLTGENAEEYLREYEFHQDQLGVPSIRPGIDAASQIPSVPVLSQLISASGDDTRSQAVIFVDDMTAVADSTVGTRLALHFPELLIYAWDPGAVWESAERTPIVGQLRRFGLTMDVPAGMAQDAWERAAMLIHERYADAFAAKNGYRTDATQPWAVLDEFYRGSNRRQVRNALWMVETIGGHTWNVVDGQPLPPLDFEAGQRVESLEALRLMGFDRDAALAMARAEHEDWCRYYRRAGWRYGPSRDAANKIHEKLVEWDDVAANPEFLNTALGSLAGTLLELATLGYRSKPLWQRYRRSGIVTAEQRSDAWTWTSESGNIMHGDAGDWAVADAAGNTWSVRADIFGAIYRHVDESRWRRTGVVLARPARGGEAIHTLEGLATAAEGDWIVQGQHGEQWPVPAAQFSQRYQETVNDR